MKKILHKKIVFPVIAVIILFSTTAFKNDFFEIANFCPCRGVGSWRELGRCAFYPLRPCVAFDSQFAVRVVGSVSTGGTVRLQ